MTKVNPSQKKLALSSSFSNKQIVVATNPAHFLQNHDIGKNILINPFWLLKGTFSLKTLER